MPGSRPDTSPDSRSTRFQTLISPTSPPCHTGKPHCTPICQQALRPAGSRARHLAHSSQGTDATEHPGAGRTFEQARPTGVPGSRAGDAPATQFTDPFSFQNVNHFTQGVPVHLWRLWAARPVWVGPQAPLASFPELGGVGRELYQQDLPARPPLPRPPTHSVAHLTSLSTTLPGPRFQGETQPHTQTQQG